MPICEALICHNNGIITIRMTRNIVISRFRKLKYEICMRVSKWKNYNFNKESNIKESQLTFSDPFDICLMFSNLH